MRLSYFRSVLFLRFRTCFLLAISVLLLTQSLTVYYIFYSVRESEESSFELSSSGHSSVRSAKSKEYEMGYQGKFPCEIASKTALSAVQRANTQVCKEELADVFCKLKNNNLFPSVLPNYCPRVNSTPGLSLGCFRDNSQHKLLSTYGINLAGCTVQKCLDVCTHSSLPYAGVRNGKECYCGKTSPPFEKQLALAYCNVPCEGRPSQYCGGRGATEIFDTGVPVRESAPLQEPSSNETVRIAFILTLNGRALRQVTRLMKVIYRPHHVYFLHVDARQDYLFRNLLPLEAKYSNIRLIRKRRSTIWGGATLLQVLLEAMEELLDANVQWDFVFNLSESDFLLQSVENLERLLAANRSRNFLKSHGRQARQFIHKQGLDRVFHQCESRMWRVGDRSLPSGIRFDGGSDWFGLSRDYVQYAVKGSDPLLLGLKSFFKYTLLPAESFFHVLLLNSRFCHTYADNNLRMTLWRRNQGCLCQHRHVVDWCGCSPMVFRTADWNHLSTVIAKNTIYFARKFESAIDQSIINRLERVINNFTQESRASESYWENIYHTFDLSPAPNTAVLCSSKAFAAQAASLLNYGRTSDCQVVPNEIVAVTSYFLRDQYQGNLILFNATLNYDTVQMEAHVKPLSKTKLFSGSHQLSTFQVGSDYDPKEQVLRNRFGILSQSSNPVLFYRWSTAYNESNMTVHFVWFDPSLNVKIVNEVNVTDTSKGNSLNMGVNPPLSAGIWTVHAILRGSKLASTEFLIMPLPEDHEELPIGKHPYQKEWEVFLQLDEDEIRRRRRESKRLPTVKGVDRDNELNRLLVNFYTVQDVCLVKKTISCITPKDWQFCHNTRWSSLSPDPKSFFV